MRPVGPEGRRLAPEPALALHGQPQVGGRAGATPGPAPSAQPPTPRSSWSAPVRGRQSGARQGGSGARGRARSRGGRARGGPAWEGVRGPPAEELGAALRGTSGSGAVVTAGPTAPAGGRGSPLSPPHVILSPAEATTPGRGWRRSPPRGGGVCRGGTDGRGSRPDAPLPRQSPSAPAAPIGTRGGAWEPPGRSCRLAAAAAAVAAAAQKVNTPQCAIELLRNCPRAWPSNLILEFVFTLPLFLKAVYNFSCDFNMV